MIADHRLIEVGLERIVSTLAQSIIAEVALQAFDQPLHGGTAGHNAFEALGHGGNTRVNRVNMYESLTPLLTHYLLRRLDRGPQRAIVSLERALKNFTHF